MTKNDHIVRVALIVGLAAVWWLAVIPGSINLIGEYVRSTDGQPSALWEQEVSTWSGYVVVVAFVAALLWYGYGASKTIDRWKSVNHRLAWSLFLLATACMAVFAGYRLSTVALGAERVWGVYVFHGCGLYYVASVLSSPTRWKYTPPLAVYFRKV